jgi:CHAD domain-containing protein
MEVTKEYIINYHLSLLYEIDESILRLQTKIKNKDIHAFRRSMKKLRALYDFLSHISPDFMPGGPLKTLKKLAKKSGMVWEMHLYRKMAKEALTKESKTETDFIDQLRTKEKQARKVLKKRLRNWNNGHAAKLQKNISKLIKPLDENVFADILTLYMQQAFSKVLPPGAALPDGSEPALLHEKRKVLKKLMYVLEMYALASEKGSAFPFEKLLQQLKRLQHQIGDWHDTELALARLHHFEEGLPHDDTGVVRERTLAPLEKKLVLDREHLLRSIRGHLVYLRTLD